MRYFALIIVFSCWSSASCQDIDSTSHDEDDLLKLIVLGTPSEPMLRFGKEWINIAGTWCFGESNQHKWQLNKINSRLMSGCHSISFQYLNHLKFHYGSSFTPMNPDAVKTYKYGVQDSILAIYHFTDDSLTKTDFYSLVQVDSVSITLQRFSTTEPPNMSWHILGEPDMIREFSPSKNRSIYYNPETCSIVCKNRIGRQKWIIELNDFGCELLFFGQYNGRKKRFDYLFQVSDKRIFIFNSKTGKFKSLKENEIR